MKPCVKQFIYGLKTTQEPSYIPIPAITTTDAVITTIDESRGGLVPPQPPTIQSYQALLRESFFIACNPECVKHLLDCVKHFQEVLPPLLLMTALVKQCVKQPV